jgi:acyl-CoA thioester hydrolase
MSAKLPFPPNTPPFEWPVRVYYEDTDAAGLVYYANYLRFCERARTEWLRARGISQTELALREQRAFVVIALEARYRQPARLDDALVIKTTVSHWRGASLTFLQQIIRGDLCLFEAKVRVACIDTVQHAPCPFPPAFRALLAPPSP